MSANGLFLYNTITEFDASLNERINPQVSFIKENNTINYNIVSTYTTSENSDIYYTCPPMAFVSYNNSEEVISDVDITAKAGTETLKINNLPSSQTFAYDFFLIGEKATFTCTTGELYYTNSTVTTKTLITSDTKFDAHELYDITIYWKNTNTTTLEP